MKATRNSFRSSGWTALAVLVLTRVGTAQHSTPLPVTTDLDRSHVMSAIGRGQAADRRAATDALPPATEAQMSAVIGEDDKAYHASAEGRGYRMDNAIHSAAALFTPGGVEFRRGTNHWSMSLRTYGRGEALGVAQDVTPIATANRVEYRRASITEWYVNGPLGLEQGFTVDRPPAGRAHDPLIVSLAVTGNVQASLDTGARGVTLNRDGAAVLRYTGLVAFDASGRELPASIETARDELRIRVDDTNAHYPITIDPYVQGVKLTSALKCNFGGACDDGEAQDQFGYSVSLSADSSTLAVGVPFKLTNGIRTGAVYVFVRPRATQGGWNAFVPIYYATKLLASDGATGTLALGSSVAISSDGSTIVAGARGLADVGPAGAAYVFVRPVNGWGSATIQTQITKLTLPTVPAATSGASSFGSSVAIAGDGATILVGAPNYNFGVAYRYYRASTGWANVASYGYFGGAETFAMSYDASTLVVGHVSTSQYRGEARVYLRRPNPGHPDDHEQQATLNASVRDIGDYFGHALAISGNGSTIVVGAPTSTVMLAPSGRRGSAYVFERPGTEWGPWSTVLSETAKLSTSHGQADDTFGGSVSINATGDTIAAGAAGVGTTYVFARPEAGWLPATEDTQVVASDAAPFNDFGRSVSLDATGSVLAVGAPWTTIGSKTFQGAAYVFTGSAHSPLADVSPASITFGSQPVGTTSGPQAVTVTNSGNAPLSVTAVTATVPFSATQHCVAASPLAPGASCAENVTFAPSSAGSITGTLTFTDSSGGVSGATQQVSLQGDAVKFQTTTSFVSVSANPVLVTRPVTVSVSVAPSSANPLIPFGTIAVRANTGESCAIDAPAGSCDLVFMTPGDRTLVATYSGDAHFNASTSSQVSIRVADFGVTVTPATQTISGQKGTFAVGVTAVNRFTGTVALQCSGGPANSTCAVSPSSITLPGTTNTAKAILTLPVGAASGTYVITFTGTVGTVTRTTTTNVVVK